MYQADLQDRKLNIDIREGSFFIDDEKLDIDIAAIDDRLFHIIYNGKSFEAILVSVDHKNKTVVLSINGNNHKIKLKDKKDLLLEKMGLNSGSDQVKKVIKAPMPGLILEVLVENGEEIKKGQPMIILEAMKMENIIKSSIDGTVSECLVSKGEGVEKNQTLIIL